MELDFSSKEEISPIQMTKLKLQTQDDLVEETEKLSQEVTAEEEGSG